MLVDLVLVLLGAWIDQALELMRRELVEWYCRERDAFLGITDALAA